MAKKVWKEISQDGTRGV